MPSVEIPVRNASKLDCEALLARFLDPATDAVEAARCRDALMAEYVDPVLRNIIAGKMRADPHRTGGRQGPQEEAARDVYGDAIVALCSQLDKMRSGNAPAATSFGAYVFTAANNACKRRGSSRRPAAADPQSQVHYLLTRRSGFARWQSKTGESLGGFAAWRDANRPGVGRQVLDALHRDPEAFAQAGLQKRNKSRKRRSIDPVALLAALLDQAGGPVEISALAAAFGAVRGAGSPSLQEVSATWRGQNGEADSDMEHEQPDTGADPQTWYERQDFLRRLWLQVKLLPLEQRQALLLNLQDGDVTRLPELQVATFREIAEVLGKETSELAKVWYRLPLDDSDLAQEMGVTAAQVKNLRQSAYRTLGWRMRPFDRGALRRLWLSTAQVPPLLAAILLLHLCDAQGAGILALLPRESIANREEISDRLQIPLADLNALWPDLPLGFSRIGTLFQKTVQEVAGLYLEEARRLRSLRVEMSTYPERSVAPAAERQPAERPSGPLRFPSRWFTLSIGGLGIAALLVAFLFGRMSEQSRIHVLEWQRARLAEEIGREHADAARRVALANEERNRALQQRRQAEQALLAEQKRHNREIQRIEKQFADRRAKPPSVPGNRLVNPFNLATLLGPLTVNRPSDLKAGQPIPRLGSNQGTALMLLDPVDTLVLNDRPTLRWEPLSGVDHYDVTVRRAGAPAGESLRSGPVSATGSPSWPVPQPLQRGGKYDWYVEANRPSGEPPYAHGQFRIADEQTVSTELERSAIAQLALGKLYAQDGLLDDAHRVFQSLVNSDAPAPVIQEAKRLLKSLQDQRQARPKPR